ncbi:MAG: PDZ domain-containing protein [Candidatus Eisenbacteria bacterium]
MAGRCFLFSVLIFVSGAILVAGTAPVMAVEPHAGMLRYPDVSATHIAFLYASDLWLVPKEGGTAVPLASPPGEETLPKFNADGSVIAFAGNYDGNNDIYTIPVSGGTPFRVTHHPGREFLCDWAPGGELVFFIYPGQDCPLAIELYTVSSKGGLRKKMPVPYGADASISADGEWLAYMLTTRDMQTWKRYRGGMATDIWLFNLKTHASKKVTDWEGTDTQPMWHKDRVYYVSDDGAGHKLNIWVYDTKTGKRRQVTQYKDYDVKWPSMGPGGKGQGEIVFQYGAELKILDLGSEQAKTVRVVVPGDRPRLRKQLVAQSDQIVDGDISATGKRAVVEARGDVWTLPAKKGSPINLSRTSGAAERDPSWSPDGKWIAYFSDATGEYELYIVQSDGNGEARKLTNMNGGFLFQPVWSPDSKWILLQNQKGVLYLCNVESKDLQEVDRSRSFDRINVSWSSDSKWIAYARRASSVLPASLWLYDVEKKAKHQVTSGTFDDRWPAFDREGKYLYFTSRRDFSAPMYEDFGTTWIYAETGLLYVVPLSKDAVSPLAPESDEETWEGKEKDKDKDKDKEKDEAAESKGDDKGAKDKKESDKSSKKKGKDATGDKEADKATDDEEGKDGDKKTPEPVKIDLEGFERRALLLPVEKGNFSSLCVNDEGKLIYMRSPIQTTDDDEAQGSRTIHLLDIDEDKDEDKEKTVISGVQDFAMSGDGKKLLVAKSGSSMAIIDAKSDQKFDSPLSTAGLTAEVDPREEWRQLLDDTWRIERDYFYDPNMHGVNWKAVREQSRKMLEDCSSRGDVAYVIREMISELNIGHAYYIGGPAERGPRVSVGMLGCDFELHDGAYRISKIIEGGVWDADARGPLSQPGVDVKVGDYVLAVNGVPVDPAKDPWASFQGLAGETVTITVSSEPRITDKARRVVLKLLESENGLRYRAWIERNRAYVDEKTGGKVGYIYVPDTSVPGQNDLVRQFYGQLTKQALIIDERWNGGGQVPTRFIELLNRPVVSYWATRIHDEDVVWPFDAQHGPKCMLINGSAGSGGDYFPYAFRAAGLGKLIGTRTWGGLVGMSGNPLLIDGTFVSVPTFGFFEKDGTWGVEGHGVDPDIEVVDDPALMVGGKDPQIDAAINLMLEEIKTNPYRAPKRPAYPDRSGMGVREQDK